MLIVLSGLPGVGKTTIAREIVAHSPSAYLRIDTIEQTLRAMGALQDVGPAGYALASSNLALGTTVVADCVNPLPVTREAWRAVAVRTSSALLEVEVVCSDLAEHRRRVEARKAEAYQGLEGRRLSGPTDVRFRLNSASGLEPSAHCLGHEAETRACGLPARGIIIKAPKASTPSAAVSQSAPTPQRARKKPNSAGARAWQIRAGTISKPCLAP